MEPQSTSVLVIGGSLVGLSAAMFLAWRGVPVVLVERHAGTSLHPRAVGYTPRTMELLRAVGLGDAIPQVPAGFRLIRARVESLAGEWFEQSGWAPEEAAGSSIERSPCLGAAVAQDGLEPILREHAIKLGADVRQGTELVAFEQNDDAVIARLRLQDGAEYSVQAAYMIGADGAHSMVRETLGIGRTGRGHMRTLRSVLFRAPLEHYLERGVSQFEIDQPGFKAFLTTYRDGRWVLMLFDDEERDEAALRDAIQRAVGLSDVHIEIITTGRWELGALVAERFSSGRVFIAGDAAHALPPARGGYGANTGIADVHNIAWKLEAVLSGAATPWLLDTYDAERRPIAWLRHQQIFTRGDYRREADGIADGEPVRDDDAMELGEIYRSAAVIGAHGALAPALLPEQWQGQPGTRAPHLWIERNGRRISTLDLFQHEWVLLSASQAWRAAAADAGRRLGIAVECLHIGHDIEPTESEALRAAFGLGRTGASLIRPDGFVAWRSADLPLDPCGSLSAALASLVAHRSIAGSRISERGEA